VHRTGNNLAEFNDRLIFPSIVTKPILHVYASRPMSIDIEVYIHKGRPWFAYPMPDDFSIDLSGGRDVGFLPKAPPSDLAAFDDGVRGTLADPREGYPWLHPRHRKQISGGRFGRVEIQHIGLRWQSVIVTPTLPPDAALPEVGDDPRFAWWSRLRDVKSDYVTSRGETERFLYYDGPTLSQAPATVKLVDAALEVAPVVDPMEKAIIARSTLNRASLYIQRDGAGIRGQRINLPIRERHSHPIAPDITGETGVRAALLQMITEKDFSGRALTEDEGNGLIDAWTPHLFKTPGRRLLLRMAREEYDRLCPIRITPVPTTLTRLGLVLYELDGAKK
jgi:hypothetical protein